MCVDVTLMLRWIMNRTQRPLMPVGNRRITLTLPVDLLTQAQRIARARQTSLNTVVAEAVTAGLRLHAAPERSQEVLIGYKKAFAGLSRADVAILDGVILESPARY